MTVHAGAALERRRARTARSAGSSCGTARPSTPTWWSSPPASGPATSWPAAAGLPVGERGGVVVDDACRTADPPICAIGECAAHRRDGATASSARASRWPRSSPTGCLGGHGRCSPAPTCRPSSSSWASTSPASATRSRTRRRARRHLHRPGRRGLQEARRQRRRPAPSSAASSSATPSSYPTLRAYVGASPARRARAAAVRRRPRPPAATCPAPTVSLLLQQRHRRAPSAAPIRERRPHRRRRRQGRAPGPAPAAAAASRW